MTITVKELQALLEKKESIRLIDVRENEEWAQGHLPQAELIPLSQFQQRAPVELDPNQTIVLYCHHGMRSARAQGFLKAQGFSHVLNLTGGIDAWSIEIDPTIKRY